MSKLDAMSGIDLKQDYELKGINIDCCKKLGVYGGFQEFIIFFLFLFS